MSVLAIDINPVDDVIDGVGDLLGGAASAAGEAVLDLVVQFVFGLIADAVAAITATIIQAMSSTTAVDLDGGFFPALTPIRQTVVGMAMALVLALLLLSVLRSLAAGEPGAIVRAALVDVPASLLTMVLSVTVAWVLIGVVDQASLAVTGDVGASMGEFTASLVAVEALTGAGLLGIIFGLLFIVGAILVWLQLLVRSALIYILLVMAPLGFATRAHPGTRQISRRTIEMGVALILSKFGVAVAFGVGAAAIDSSNGVGAGDTVDLGGMMTGVALMLMAAFMPWVIWKVIPIVEGATATAGVERAPMRGAVAAGSLAVAASAGASQLAGAGGASSSGSGQTGGPAGAAGAAGSSGAAVGSPPGTSSGAPSAQASPSAARGAGPGGGSPGAGAAIVAVDTTSSAAVATIPAAPTSGSAPTGSPEPLVRRPQVQEP
jgi:hypothetical protein